MMGSACIGFALGEGAEGAPLAQVPLGKVLRDISKTLNFSAKNRTMYVETPSEPLHSLVAVEGLPCG